MEYEAGLDYCTMSPDEIMGVNISYACYLHDRQYRNEVKNRKTRKEADKTLRDMIYRKFKKTKFKKTGWVISRLYYLGVRCFGWTCWEK